MPEWRAVVGYEGYYEISDGGYMRSLVTRNNRWKAGVILSGRTTKKGYIAMSLTRDGKKVIRFAHRLVAEAFIGPVPEGMEVNHKDGVKHNNTLSNLEYVTPSANQLHAYRLGLKKARRKLTENDVRSIRTLRAAGMPVQWIADRFQVKGPVVSNIVNRRRWDHVA